MALSPEFAVLAFRSQPANSTSSDHSSSSGLSGGVVAGIAVGSAAGVGLVTFLATYLFMRKTSRGKSGHARPRRLEKGKHREKDNGAVVPEPIPKSDHESQRFQAFVPRSSDDPSVAKAAFGLLDRIDIHVDNYYRNSSTPFSIESIDSLSPIASEELLEAVRKTAQQSAKTKAIVSYCLTKLVLSRISPFGNPSRTLLPLDFAMFSEASDGQSAEAQQARYWSRVFSTYLHPNVMEGRQYTEQRRSVANDIISLFSQTFSQCEGLKVSRDERVNSLAKILEDAARVGVMLYSQPSLFEFRWRSFRAGERLEKSPALYKVADQQGSEISPPQLLVNSVDHDE